MNTHSAVCSVATVVPCKQDCGFISLISVLVHVDLLRLLKGSSTLALSDVYIRTLLRLQVVVIYCG